MSYFAKIQINMELQETRIGQDWAKIEQIFVEDMDKIEPRLSQDQAKIELRSSKDRAKIEPRLSQDWAKIELRLFRDHMVSIYYWNAPGVSGTTLECPWIEDVSSVKIAVYATRRNRFYVVLCLSSWVMVQYNSVWLKPSADKLIFGLFIFTFVKSQLKCVDNESVIFFQRKRFNW